MNLSRTAIRSVRGQLALLGAAYTGAVVLAVAALCLRSLVFERHIGEKHVPLSAELDALRQDLAAGDAGPERWRRLTESERDALYGAWIDAPERDPEKKLARLLLSREDPGTLGRIRQTLVVGKYEQRLHAVQLLALIPADDWTPEAAQLACYAQEQARRRGEPELVRQAEAARERFDR
jgi:hypothetical protein